MADVTNIVKLGVDLYKGNVTEYSKNEAVDVMRQALIEANGGSTKLNAKNIRNNGAEIFSIVEEILDTLIADGFADDDAFNKIVDFKNIAEGDENRFVVENAELFKVSKLADGTQALRRQRIGGKKIITVDTEVHGVKIYEELARVLSGAIDWMEFIDRVYKSVKQSILEEITDLWANFTESQIGTGFVIDAGSYTEATFLALIDKVEAAAGGKPATIIGTKPALRPLNGSISTTGDDAMADIYQMGYVGKYFGSDVIAVPNRYKVGTQTLAFPTDKVLIIAGDSKPIKVVYEGDALIIEGDKFKNADLSQEFALLQKYGVGLVMDTNSGIGMADIA